MARGARKRWSQQVTENSNAREVASQRNPVVVSTRDTNIDGWSHVQLALNGKEEEDAERSETKHPKLPAPGWPSK